MRRIQNAILDIDARLSREEFTILCFTIQAYQTYLPQFPQMKEILPDIRVRTSKRTSAAVAKALDRAVIKMFETGDRTILAQYQASWLYERPFPNEVVRVIAVRLWDGQNISSTPRIGSDHRDVCSH